MKKVLIIGAGPAGITAGLELLRQNKNEYAVTILEESDQIGGISRTVNVDGNRMDIGGHRFFSKSEEVNAWWESILKMQGGKSFDDKTLGRESQVFAGGPDPETADEVMLERHRVSRIFCFGKFFDYPVSLKLQTLVNLGFARTMSAGFSYLKAMVCKKPEDSLENFYINRFGKKLYSLFFEDYTEKLWGRHPSEISADWGAQRVKGLSIREVLKNVLSPKKSEETSLIEAFKYPKFGPGQLWETAAKEFESLGGTISKNTKVVGLETKENCVSSVYTEDGKTIEGDIIISSMPIKDLISAFPEKQVPNEIKQIADGLPYRDFVTVGLLVKDILLENKTDIKTLGDIVPDCWIYVQDKGVKLGRIQVFNNWSPYMVNDPLNTIWLGLEFFCTEGDDFWNLSEEEAIAFATRELVKIGVIAKDAVLCGHRERVKKAYPAYFDTYDALPKVIEFLNGYENLYCIGRNGQHRYNNMDHSMMTAMETVKNIENGQKDKSNIWNVNTEAEYHEEAENGKTE